MAPLSQTAAEDVNGYLIVSGEAADGAVAPLNTLQVGGKDGSGNLQTFLTDTTGVLVTKSTVALTPASPTSSSVGITSAQIVAANANRKGLVLTNTSNNRISLGFAAAAVLNSGITLYPGGIYVMDAYLFNTGAVNAIASVASSNIAIQELS